MQTKVKFDFHTHHDRCGHAEGKIRDYIESAINKGFHMIGISDHSPYFASQEDQLHPGIAMAKSQFPEYVDEVLRLKEEYKGKIDVLLGIESDYFPEHLNAYRKQLKQFPFDYVIGSVHYVDGVSIFNRNRWEGMTKEEKIQTKEAYYALIEQSAKSGLFQILGHIDAMKAYYPEFSMLETDTVDRTLKVIANYNVAIEVNTSGKMKDCGGWYPANEILERAQHYGVKVTFGSDAHHPDRVGDDFEKVQTYLKEIGFKEWAYFREKSMVLVPL